MKEVKKCSISGIAFTLDADAYALLSRYLDSLKATYPRRPTATKSSPTSRRASPN